MNRILQLYSIYKIATSETLRVSSTGPVPREQKMAILSMLMANVENMSCVNNKSYSLGFLDPGGKFYDLTKFQIDPYQSNYLEFDKDGNAEYILYEKEGEVVRADINNDIIKYYFKSEFSHGLFAYTFFNTGTDVLRNKNGWISLSDSSSFGVPDDIYEPLINARYTGKIIESVNHDQLKSLIDYILKCNAMTDRILIMSHRLRSILWAETLIKNIINNFNVSENMYDEYSNIINNFWRNPL